MASRIDEILEEAAGAKDRAPSNRRSPTVQSISFDSSEFQDFISTEFGYVTALIDIKDKDDKPFEWYDAQIAFLQTPGHTVTNKCRQVGWSYLGAAKKFARANLVNEDISIVITSITKEEAQNKIAYVKQFIDGVPNKFRRKILYETKQSIEFQNSDGSTAKIISHAQKESRGLHGDYYFDEVEFYKEGAFPRLLNAAQPGARKVGGIIDILSTPWDPLGQFRKMIDSEAAGEKYGADGEKIKEYSEYTKFKIHWWDVPFYCTNVLEARKFAKEMELKERVVRYGTKLILDAYNNASSDEIFQQEYEGVFVSGGGFFFNKSDLKACIVRDIDEIFTEDFSLHWNQSIDPEILEMDTQNSINPIEKELLELKIIPKRYGDPQNVDSWRELLGAIHRKEVTPNLVCGIDIATTGHATDIVIDELVRVGPDRILIVPRFWAFKNNWDLPDQQEFFEDMFSKLPLIKVGMDTQGIAMQLGQYFSNSIPALFESVPMITKNLDKCMFALFSALQERRKGINNYLDNIKNFGGTRRERGSSGLNNSIWKLKKTRTGHCDSVISNAISTYLADRYGKGINMVIGGSSTPIERFKANTLGVGFGDAGQERVSKANAHNSMKVDRLSQRQRLSNNLSRHLKLGY